MNNSSLDKGTSPFSSNFFIVSHRTRHKFVSIAKAGCTSVKYSVAIDEKRDLSKLKSNQSIHDYFGYFPDNKTLHPIKNNLNPDYVRAAVWRDPLERVVSWYKDKVVSAYNAYTHGLGLREDNNWDRIIEFLEFELGKSNPEWIDEHLRPHSKYYSPEDIDVLVQLNDLDSYLKFIGASVPSKEKNNATKKNIDLGISEKQKDDIKRLYKEDYQMFDEIKHKTWSKEQETGLIS